MKKTAVIVLTCCSLGAFNSANAESQFEYTIINDTLNVSEKGTAMGFRGASGNNQPCAISIVLGNPKLSPNKLNLEFKYSDEAGLQSGDYPINPDAQVSSSWFAKNQRQVRAVFYPTGSHKKTLAKMQAIDGSLSIDRDGLELSGQFQGTLAEVGVTAFGKPTYKNKAKVTASFKHQLVKGMKDFNNAYLCK